MLYGNEALPACDKGRVERQRRYIFKGQNAYSLRCDSDFCFGRNVILIPCGRDRHYDHFSGAVVKVQSRRSGVNHRRERRSRVDGGQSAFVEMTGDS